MVLNRAKHHKHLNSIQDGLFWCCSRMGEGAKICQLNSAICPAYPKMMKFGTVIPCLKKIQKICESSDTLLESC